MKKILFAFSMLLVINTFAQVTEDQISLRLKNLIKTDLISVSAGSDFKNIEVLDVNFSKVYTEDYPDTFSNFLVGIESLYESNNRTTRMTGAVDLLGAAIVTDNILLGFVIIEPGFFSIQDKKSDNTYGGFSMGNKVLIGFSDKFLGTLSRKTTFGRRNYTLLKAHGTYCVTNKIKLNAETCVYTANDGQDKITDLELAEDSFFNIEALYEVHTGLNIEAGVNLHNRNDAGKLMLGATLKMGLF